MANSILLRIALFLLATPSPLVIARATGTPWALGSSVRVLCLVSLSIAFTLFSAAWARAIRHNKSGRSRSAVIDIPALAVATSGSLPRR